MKECIITAKAQELNIKADFLFMYYDKYFKKYKDLKEGLISLDNFNIFASRWCIALLDDFDYYILIPYHKITKDPKYKIKMALREKIMAFIIENVTTKEDDEKIKARTETSRECLSLKR